MNKIIINATVSMVKAGDMVLLDAEYDDSGREILPFTTVDVASIEHARASGITIIRDASGFPTMASPSRRCTISR